MPDRFKRLEGACQAHGQFTLLLVLFLALRLMSLLLFRPGGFTLEWAGYWLQDPSAIRWSAQGLYPFIHYWSEYPPLLLWPAIATYRISLLIPPWTDPNLWFNILTGLVFLPFEAGNLALVYATAIKLYGRSTTATRCAWVYALLFAPLFIWLTWFETLPAFFLLLGLYAILDKRPILAGLAGGIGFMIKIIPLVIAPVALRALSGLKGKFAYLLTASGAILVAASPFLLVNPRFLLAPFIHTLTRPPWETVWALMAGIYSGGQTYPIEERLDPSTAGIAMYRSDLPWLWITLAFALAYLVIYLRPMALEVKTRIVAFSGLTMHIFLLYSKGWSPQYIVYVVPIIVLLLPNLRGVVYAFLLTSANLLEFPVSLVMFPQQHSLLASAVIFRTAILLALAFEYGFILFPTPVLARVAKTALVVILTSALVGGPLIGLGVLQAYARQALNDDPYAETITFLQSEPPSAVLFVDRALYTRFYPFLRGKSLYLLEENRLRERLGAALIANSCVWVVATGDNDLEVEIERWLSDNAFPMTSKWFANARLTSYSAGTIPSLQSLPKNFNGEIMLEAYALGGLRRGEALPVALAWTSLQPTGKDYTVFVHLTDSSGALHGQRDSQPLNGFKPTSSWQPGEEIIDHHGLMVPSDLASGTYWVAVGLYEPSTGKRLPVLGQPGKDEVLLGPLELGN